MNKPNRRYFLLFLFICCHLIIPAQTNIVKLEYWFDESYTLRQQISKTGSTISIKDDIDISSLSNGFHQIHMRAKDSNGIWSIVHSQVFYKADSIVEDKGIVAVEYWMDDQFEEKITINDSPSKSLILSNNIDIGHLEPGFHALNIRSKDDKNTWSVVHTQTFYHHNNIFANNKIDAYSYWFNKNIDLAEFVLLEEPGNPYDLQTVINVPDSLPLGKHLFNIRFRDKAGNWSITETDTFKLSEDGSSLAISTKKQTFVYPNPFENRLNITSTDIQGKTNASLINFNGVVVWSGTIEIEAERSSIFLPELPESVYLLRLTNNNKCYDIKIKKTKRTY